MDKKNEFANRLMRFGIVNEEDEINQLIEGAKQTADMFFADEKAFLNADFKQVFNSNIGKEIYDEFCLRFIFGFCEGIVFYALSNVAKLLEKGYKVEQIAELMDIKEEEIARLKESLEL